MALKLKGSTSGFVAIDAPSVAGNNTLTLPENNGSAHQILANDITAGVTTFTQITVSRNGDLTVPGTISIGGTLTYEDVTSVDSVGIVTARGLSIFGNTTGLQVASGISTFQAVTGTTGTFTGDVDIADKIVHTGDTNTAIRFPAADTVTVETGGSERIRIDSSGNFGVGTNSPTETLHVLGDSSSNLPIKWIRGGSSHAGYLYSDGGGSGIVGSDGVLNNTGMYLVTDSRIDFRVNGAERLRIASDGKMGLGTNDPKRLLHLSSNNTVFALTDTAASTDQKTKYILSDAGAFAFGKLSDDYNTATEQFRIGNSGNIGINEQSPSCKLDIEDGASGGDGITEILRLNGSPNSLNDGIKINFARAGSSCGHIVLEKVNNNNTTDLIISTRTSNTVAETVRITGGGNVGINETAPSEKLQIDGDILLGGQANSGTADYAIKFEYNNHQFAKIVGDGRDSSGYGDIDFYTSTGSGVSNLTQRMTIRADGKIGIGEASPINLFTISSASTQDDAVGNLQIRYTGSTTTINSGITFKNYSGTSQFMQWDTNGCRIGNRIVTNTGNGHVYITTGSDDVRLSINASNGYFTGSGSNDISDGRLKENIASISNATATIKQLLGKTFTWKEEAKLGTDTIYGFIAQELKTVLPDLVYQDVGINRVSKDADKQGYGQGEIVDEYSDDYKDDSKSEWSMAINTSGIIPVLVEAFKELEARIAALEG